MTLDGKQFQTIPTAAGRKQGIVLSPDGNQLFYRLGRTELRIVNVDGSNPRDIATGAVSFHGQW